MTHRVPPTSTPLSSRVFLYVRVSTERQSEEGFSLADQESRLRGYVQSIGHEVAAVFVEAGVSGAKQLHRRPKGAELLKTLRAGDHVVALRLDRLFRSASDALNVAEELKRRRVFLHICDMGGEVTETGAAQLVFGVLAAVSQMERTRISERVRSVKQHLRRAGYYTGGKLARGYSVTDDGKLSVEDGWPQCLAWMKAARNDEMSYRRIATEARERFGFALDYSTVYRVLAGRRQLDEEQSQAAHLAEPERLRTFKKIHVSPEDGI